MSNPHPHKRPATRVNPDGGLPLVMDPLASRRALNITTPYAPRQRQPNEALPRHVNTFAGDGNTYRPEPAAYVRPGADDHLRHLSKVTA